MPIMQIIAGAGPFGNTPNTTWTINGTAVAYYNSVSGYNEGAWITDTAFGSWSYTLGDGSQVTNKGKFWNPTVDDGPGGPAGSPSQIRYTFAGNGIQGYSNARLRANTHDDPFAQRRVKYNTSSGTTTISTGGNTTQWVTVGGNTWYWVECGNYGGGDGGRSPSGMMAVEIDGSLCVDPDYASYGG
jgi:hypothetical protein